MILCDVGNSYLHFFYKGKIWREEIDCITKKSKDFDIFYISVNPNAEKKLLSSHSRCINVSKFISIDTIYQGLGIDRAAACVTIKNGVIIDCGSAITIDIMQEGIHLGGYILPGISSYKNMFHSISKSLQVEFNLGVALDVLPQCTKDAISYGCLKSIILTIEDIAKENHIYFTGGDGKFLSKFFSNSIYDNTLVFKGMIDSLKQHNII